MLSTSFNIHSSEHADPSLLSRINDTVSRQRTAKAITAGAVATPTIDAVIYADSTIEGPDTLHYGESFVAERRGEHDAAISVLIAKSKGETSE